MSVKNDQKKDWLKIKIDKLQSIDSAYCYCCNRITENLQFHHCEYRADDVNSTLLDDLVLLCSCCHNLLHSFHRVSLIKSYDLRNPLALDKFKLLLSKLEIKTFQLNIEKAKINKDIILLKLQLQLPKRRYNSGYLKSKT